MKGSVPLGAVFPWGYRVRPDADDSGPLTVLLSLERSHVIVGLAALSVTPLQSKKLLGLTKYK